MNQTSRYKLNQWDPEDRILREDFNADNAKLETALGNFNASLKTHANQLQGVPALGRNLYNLFLRQKKAGQDVSWMEGLFYDDFADQSKIASMGPGMSWSSSEKCIHFTPVDGQLSAQLVTTEFQSGLVCYGAFVFVRHSLYRLLEIEYRLQGEESWTPLELARNDPYWSTNVQGEKAAESVFYLPSRLGNAKFQLRLTLTTFDNSHYWPTKIYDYGCMLLV